VIKKDSVERLVTLDLSYPVGNSINDGISQEYYLGKRLIYVTTMLMTWLISSN
jgi:hypothetical protein